jgi:hypothetical protein
VASDALTPVGEMRLGDHLCFAFADEQEQQMVLAGFVDDGLTAGDKVLWLTDEPEPVRVLDILRRRGVRPDPALATGQLVLRGIGPSGEAGALDPARMVAALLDETSAALAHGYRGLRLTGAPGRLLGHTAGADRLLEYETRLGEVFATGSAMAICQYDRMRLAPELLVSIQRAHGGGVGANPEFRDPLLRITRRFQPAGLLLEGEVDMTNRAGLAQALAAATASGHGDLHLDLSRLEFIHVDGLRLLVETGAKLPCGRYLVLDAVPPHLRRIIGLVGWDRTPGLKLGGELR